MLNLEPQSDQLKWLLSHKWRGSYELYRWSYEANKWLQAWELSPLQLIILSVIATIALRYMICFACCIIRFCKDFRKNVMVALFNFVIWLPCGRYFLRREQDKARQDFQNRIKSKRKNLVKNLPDKAWREETIMNRIKQGSDEAKQFYTNGGKMSASVFCANDEHWDFISEVMRETIESNPLWATEFANVSQLEAEIIKMTLNLFNAPEGACGLAPSGGTESLILAMLAYRQWGRQRGITRPNIVAPQTAHGSLDKGSFYFDVEFRKAPIVNGRVDLDQMRKLIDSNTVCLVASAPDYAFGMFDPIPEIAQMALDHGTNFHVDACLGSYIVPFTEEAGFKLPCQYDFKVNGVTSMTADPHKYCNGPKGCSVLMFRTKVLRRLTFFPVTTWSGGMYVTPTMAGSRSGAVIAGTWAAIVKTGREGFLLQAKTLLTAARNIRNQLKKIPEVTLMSDHDSTVVAFTSNLFNCAALNDLMKQKHRWTLQVVMNPLASHLILTDANCTHWSEFVPALQDCIAQLLQNPADNDRGDAALYGLTEKIPNKGVVGDFLVYYVEAVLDAL